MKISFHRLLIPSKKHSKHQPAWRCLHIKTQSGLYYGVEGLPQHGSVISLFLPSGLRQHVPLLQQGALLPKTQKLSFCLLSGTAKCTWIARKYYNRIWAKAWTLINRGINIPSWKQTFPFNHAWNFCHFPKAWTRCTINPRSPFLT